MISNWRLLGKVMVDIKSLRFEIEVSRGTIFQEKALSQTLTKKQVALSIPQMMDSQDRIGLLSRLMMEQSIAILHR